MISEAIGIDMPPDFCTAAHNQVVKILGPCIARNPKIWPEVASGWNAVAIRFKALANADERYTTSVRSKEARSSPNELFLQQEAIFSFFMNGSAALESFTYSMYAMGAMLRPQNFPMNTPAELRAISPEATKSRFTVSFRGTLVETRLSALIRNACFKRWGLIRNILVHRCEPPRHHYLSVGSGAPPTTNWEILDGLAIDDKTTASHRRWLATILARSLKAAEDFVIENFA